MSRAPLRVLFVDDSDNDVALMARHLRRGGYHVEYGRVVSADDLRAALARRSWDIAIVDFNLPRFSAPEALAVLHAEASTLPCIVVSGVMQEELLVSTLRLGARDCLTKDNLTRLAAVVERELGARAEPPPEVAPRSSLAAELRDPLVALVRAAERLRSIASDPAAIDAVETATREIIHIYEEAVAREVPDQRTNRPLYAAPEVSYTPGSRRT